MDITQCTWHHGDILKGPGWKILALIPKVNMDTWGIGLLGFLCNVVEAIINTRLRESLRFHDVLHGLHAGKGIGTAILELNLAQELASVDQ